MALRSLTPNLIVEDVSATLDYYRDVLGFSFLKGVLEGTEDAVFEATGQPLGFAMPQRDDVEIMLQSREGMEVELGKLTPASGDAVALYIDVDDVDALYAEIGGRVNLVMDLRETFYGAREFSFRDCNGFIIGFAQQPPRD